MPTYQSQHPDWERIDVYAVVRGGMIIKVLGSEAEASIEAQETRRSWSNMGRAVTVRGLHMARCQASYLAHRAPIALAEYQTDADWYDQREDETRRDNQQPVWMQS